MIVYASGTSKASAQSSDRGIAFSGIKNYGDLASFVNENSSADKASSATTKESLKAAEKDLNTSKANLKAMKANFRAAENFRKTFKDAPEAKWTVEENAIVASFAKDQVKTNVVYSKKGNWIHTLSYYPGDQTPADIRTIVENAYPNHDIALAVAVKEGDIDFYIVQMEDRKTIKQVGVYNGETNLIKQLNKSM